MAEAELNAKEPEVVYHYTSIDTMMKIVDQATIWATSISYLNDTSEGEHYLKLIRERIAIYRQTHSLADERIFDDVMEKSLPGFNSRPFVASFSQEDDFLPQWRSYCPQGNGVAVGFRVECLKRSFPQKTIELASMRADEVPGGVILVPPRVSFGRIDYIDGSTIQSLDDDIATAIGESMPTHIRSHYFKGIVEGRASFKKHPSFLNEREYRLLVSPIVWADYYLDFRTTRSTLVPFIRVSIPRRHSNYVDSPKFVLARWDFIDRVVVGPTSNKSLSCDAVSSFFRKHGMEVEVVSSSIPYRDW
jgi:hypothetical protein